MCRAIKTLHNFSPPATNDEIRASSLQFVRKLSGFTKPSRANEEAFNRAVDDVAHARIISLNLWSPIRCRAIAKSKRQKQKSGQSGGLPAALRLDRLNSHR